MWLSKLKFFPSRLLAKAVAAVRPISISKAKDLSPFGACATQGSIDKVAECNHFQNHSPLMDFPVNKLAVSPAPVRFGFIPEECFQFFYSKTGVTGPYVFGIGLFTLMASKNSFLLEPALVMASLGVMSSISDAVQSHLAKKQQALDDLREIEQIQEAIEMERQSQWEAEGCISLMELKKENVRLQIEAAHRQALQDYHKQVIGHLEYLKECNRIHEMIRRKNMVQYVVSNVIKSLPDLPKEDLDKVAKDVAALCMRVV